MQFEHLVDLLDDDELRFVVGHAVENEALAWAHLAAGHRGAAADECARMRPLLEQVADAEYRAWAAADLQALVAALG